ncbi:MAG: 30S ribosomal protein S2 [Promethearchaeota archaeon]
MSPDEEKTTGATPDLLGRESEGPEIETSLEEIKREERRENLLCERNDYLAAGVHIGTKLKTKHTRDIIYRITSYGLYVINILKTDERLRVAAKFLSEFDPSKILVCSVRRYGQKPVKMFREVVGTKVISGRFIPGTLTNPMLENYTEAEVLVICDPHADKQALSEAQMARIPVVALIDTDDSLSGVDLAIPTNNRGRKALSLIFFLLARQILRERGDIPPDGETSFTAEDFESKIRPIAQTQQR